VLQSASVMRAWTSFEQAAHHEGRADDVVDVLHRSLHALAHPAAGSRQRWRVSDRSCGWIAQHACRCQRRSLCMRSIGRAGESPLLAGSRTAPIADKGVGSTIAAAGCRVSTNHFSRTCGVRAITAPFPGTWVPASGHSFLHCTRLTCRPCRGAPRPRRCRWKRPMAPRQ